MTPVRGAEEGVYVQRLSSDQEVSEHLVPVVLGGDVLAYSYARCFHEAYGIRTMVVSGVDVKVTSSSRFVDYHVDDAMTRGEDAIVEMLERLGERLAGEGRVGLLLGSADWHVRIISHNKERLERLFVVPYNDFALLDDITQKGRFYQICDELGIDYPDTVSLDCRLPEPGVDLAALRYPLVAKPSNSAAYDLLEFAGKEKVYELSAPEELARVFGLLHEAGYAHDLIVQDFVPGGDDAIRSLTTYSGPDGELLAVSGGRVVLQDHSPARIGNPVCILLERSERLIEDARRFCRHVGYRGFANFDVKYDERDGSYRFFEVNVRPGANTWYMALGGVNFARLIVDDYVLGRELPYREAYRDALYTLVPERVVRDFVADDELRGRALACFSEGRAASPFDYAPDTLSHRLWSWLRAARQHEKFERYLGRPRR